MKHKFKAGDQVVYTNDFGVCWGVKTITALYERTGGPTYHYKDSDTPWFSVSENNFTLATPDDLRAQEDGDSDYFQRAHGFTPTVEQMGGCY